MLNLSKRFLTASLAVVVTLGASCALSAMNDADLSDKLDELKTSMGELRKKLGDFSTSLGELNGSLDEAANPKKADEPTKEPSDDDKDAFAELARRIGIIDPALVTLNKKCKSISSLYPALTCKGAKGTCNDRLKAWSKHLEGLYKSVTDKEKAFKAIPNEITNLDKLTLAVDALDEAVNLFNATKKVLTQKYNAAKNGNNPTLIESIDAIAKTITP